MIDFDERLYYLARAANCRELADAAATPQIASIHMELRRRYLEIADETPLKLKQTAA